MTSRQEYKAKWYKLNCKRIRKKDQEQCAAKREYRFAYKLKKLYGLSLADFDAMAAEQDHKCGICKRGFRLCVDHDHLTGEIRGLLCNGCNLALGHFYAQHLLDAARTYLQGETK